MDELYYSLAPLANLPRAQKYVQTYKILLKSLPLPNREGMRQHLAEFWNVSPESLNDRSYFKIARDFRLFCIWGNVTDDSRHEHKPGVFSVLESLRLNLS
ncbi:MAG: hypothetical protein AABX11_03360 [Nanoarchaeota archaeon]